MSTEVVFWTQIASLLVFIISLFVLYRILVSTKDATIELLREKILNLEKKLEDAQTQGPDVLAEKLSRRVTILSQELERLSRDQDKNKTEIAQREEKLREAKEQLASLKEQMERARELLDEYLCPNCKSPMITRDCREEYFDYDGRDISIDHEFVEYECGFAMADGKELRPCKGKRAT